MGNMLQNRIKVSVCMATYNGEKYLKEQLDSILVNLNDGDELIISDDGSTDRSMNILIEYANMFPQINIIRGPGLGVKKNFENAIMMAKCDWIFLADQDDVWENNKIEKCLKVISNNNITCLLHNAQIVDSTLNECGLDFFSFRNSKKGFVRNIIKNSYIGCCMAFDARLKEQILPIPNDIEMHDQWIGLICELCGNVYFMQDCLIKYRRHDNNVSSMGHYPLYKMIKNRIALIMRIIGYVGGR